MQKEVKTNIAVFLSLLFLTLLFSFPYMNVGLERDEGMFLLMASKILRGGVPYRDMMDNKPILLYFFLTIPAYLFESWIHGLRLFGFFLVALVAFIIFLIGKNLRDTELGFLSAFVFIFLQLFTPRMVGYAILSETVSNLFAVAAIYLLLSKKLNLRTAFAIGILSSLAFLSRQTSLFILLIVPIYIYYNKEIKQKFKYLTYFVFGVFLLIAVFALYFAVNSATGDAMYNMFSSMLDAYGPYATYNITEGSWDMLRFFAFLYVFSDKIALTFLMTIGVINLQNMKEKFILLWLILSLTFVLISPSIYLHYHILVLPAFSLLVGMGCKNILGMGKIFYKNKFVYYSFTIVSIIAIATLLVVQFSYFVWYPTYVMNGGKAYVDTLSYNDEIALMNILKNTTEDERIFVFPSEPQVYYLTGKDPINKMPFFNEIWFAHADYNQLNKFLLQPLLEKKPKYIIIANNIHFEYINKTENGRLFMQYVDKYYYISKEIGIAQVYEMN